MPTATRMRLARPRRFPAASGAARPAVLAQALAPSRSGPESAAPALPAVSALLRLQHAVGKATVARLLASPPGAEHVQRDIAVAGEDYPTLSVGSLASKYCDQFKAAAFGRVRAALVLIEQSGEAFPSRAVLFDRVAEVMEAEKGKAIQPLWREPLAARVSIALDYQFDKIDPKPLLTFVETYPTSWDTTGGWGAEYTPPFDGEYRWVVHVHRGPNGGLKAARVKPYAERKLPEKGMSVGKFEHLYALGVKQVDTTKSHST